MTIIEVEQYSAFSCIGSACPDTCCAGWNVFVDKKTESYYRTVGGEFGAYLNDNLLQAGNRTKIRMCKGRCAFLDEQNLCRIYQELGRDKLCQVCTRYPRVIILKGILALKTLTFACPEVVRLTLANSGPTEILFGENRQEPMVKADFDWQYHLLLGQTLLAGISLMQNRFLSIAHRQRLFLMMCKAMDDALDAGDWDGARGYLEVFSTPAAYSTLCAEEFPMNLTEKIRILSDASLLFVMNRNKNRESAAQMFEDRAVWLRESDDHLAAAWKRLEILNSGTYAAEQEHFLVYLILRHFVEAMEYKSFFRLAVFIVLVNQFQRLFTACFPEGSEEKDAVPPLAQRIQSICCLSRLLEHDSMFAELLYRILDVYHDYDLEKLYQIVS